jgi:hypothetical protein
VLPGGYLTALWNVPLIAVPFDEIEATFPLRTCSRNVGLNGIATRRWPFVVFTVEASTMFSSSRTRKKARNPGPKMRGRRCGGAPRPSGSGRTRQPPG